MTAAVVAGVVSRGEHAPALTVVTRTVSAGSNLASGALPHDLVVEWDRFVAEHADGTAFHRIAWLRAVAGGLRHSAWALEARDADGVLRGVLPLVQVRSALFGNFLVGVPFSSYGGPLGSPDAVTALCAQAVTLAGECGVELLELRGRRSLAHAPDGFTVSTRKVTVTLPLEGDPEAVFKRFPSKLRSQLRRGERDGVIVTVGPGQVAPFYAVFAEHMRDLGTPALPQRFFEQLATQFGDDMLFAIATLDGVPIACGAGFRYGAEFEITWASSLRAYSRISPNMLMYWKLMATVTELGVRTFNFGRCTVDSGTHRFKKQWGGIDETLPWYQWRPDGGVGDTPSPGGAFAVAEAIWKRLPILVTRTIGPHIARLLP